MDNQFWTYWLEYIDSITGLWFFMPHKIYIYK